MQSPLALFLVVGFVISLVGAISLQTGSIDSAVEPSNINLREKRFIHKFLKKTLKKTLKNPGKVFKKFVDGHDGKSGGDFTPSPSQNCRIVEEQQNQPSCRTVYHEECATVNEENCSTHSEEECFTDYLEQCLTVQENVCHVEDLEQCKVEYNQHCETTYVQQCSNQPVCHQEYEQQCRDEMSCSRVVSSRHARDSGDESVVITKSLVSSSSVGDSIVKADEASREKRGIFKKLKKTFKKFKKLFKNKKHKKKLKKYKYEYEDEYEDGDGDEDGDEYGDEYEDEDEGAKKKRSIDKHEAAILPREKRFIHNKIVKNLGKKFKRVLKSFEGVNDGSGGGGDGSSCTTETVCEEIPVEKCHNEQSCSDVPKEVCKKVPQKVCHTNAVEKCHTVPQQECRQVPKEVCKKNPRTTCNIVPSTQCRNVPSEQCTTDVVIVQKEVCTISGPNLGGSSSLGSSSSSGGSGGSGKISFSLSKNF